MTQNTTTNERIILSQPGFPALTSSNIAKFANKLEQFEKDGKFMWDLMDRAGLTYKFEIKDKASRALKAFADNDDVEGCSRAGDAIRRISQSVRTGALQVHFIPGSAAERDIQPALIKSMGGVVPSSSVEPVAEDFEGLAALSVMVPEV